MTTTPAIRTTFLGAHRDAQDFHITGRLIDLQALIAAHAAHGSLVHATAPTGTHHNAAAQLRLRRTSPGLRADTAGLRAQAPRLAPVLGIPASRPRYRRAVAIALAISGAVTALVTATAYLLGQLVELIATHAGLIVAGLVLAAILAALAARGSGRRHCPGC